MHFLSLDDDGNDSFMQLGDNVIRVHLTSWVKYDNCENNHGSSMIIIHNNHGSSIIITDRALMAGQSITHISLMHVGLHCS